MLTDEPPAMASAHITLYKVARSNLAALQASLPDYSILNYSQILLDLDRVHGWLFPATAPLDTSDRHALYAAARSALAGIAEHADRLSVELVIADLDATWNEDRRTAGDGASL